MNERTVSFFLLVNKSRDIVSPVSNNENAELLASRQNPILFNLKGPGTVLYFYSADRTDSSSSAKSGGRRSANESNRIINFCATQKSSTAPRLTQTIQCT